MAESTHSDASPARPSDLASWAWLTFSWLWVGIPLAWGVLETVKRSLALFR